MEIKPIISGVIAKNCNPEGCKQVVLEDINSVKNSKPIKGAPKKVLVIGASSGLGLGSRISLAFGGGADTIGISYERGPSESHTGTAGWHNNIAFSEQAESEGLIAKNFVGDAFSADLRKQVADFIKNEFGGTVDCVVYSLATGIRPKPDGSGMWKSALKTLGKPHKGNFINIEQETMVDITLPVGTEQEVEDTVKVMGGEDWQGWIDFLLEKNLLAQGTKTVAYSYIGSEITYPVYFGGTLGKAKQHLHLTSDHINETLSAINGEAHIGLCKSIVSKASVFIPGLSSYLLALTKLLKERNEYESCVEHMHRLMTDFLYAESGVVVDEQRLMRPDNFELNPEVQEKVKEMMTHITAENFTSPEIGDYDAFISEFMRINGFIEYKKESEALDA